MHKKYLLITLLLSSNLYTMEQESNSSRIIELYNKARSHNQAFHYNEKNSIPGQFQLVPFAYRDIEKNDAYHNYTNYKKQLQELTSTIPQKETDRLLFIAEAKSIEESPLEKELYNNLMLICTQRPFVFKNNDTLRQHFINLIQNTYDLFLTLNEFDRIVKIVKYSLQKEYPNNHILNYHVNLFHIMMVEQNSSKTILYKAFFSIYKQEYETYQNTLSKNWSAYKKKKTELKDIEPYIQKLSSQLSTHEITKVKSLAQRSARISRRIYGVPGRI